MTGKKTDLGLIRIRSAHALLDGLSGKAEMFCDEKLIRLVLNHDAPQADLENGDELLIPIEAVTFLHKIEA